MRRLISIWAFALFLAVPLWAQRGGRGGGFAGGGHVGSFGGGAGFGSGRVRGLGARSGGMMGPRFGGMRPGPARTFNTSRFGNSHFGVAHGPFLHDGFHHHTHGVRFHTFGFRNPCFGFGCYPYWGYGYSPWLWDWWNDDYSFDRDYNNNLALANEMNQQSLEQQRMWREEQQDGDQDSYAPYPARPRPTPAAPRSSQPSVNDPPATPMIPTTVLVFRDQHKEEIHNYAIVGQTLWNFASQRTEKVPLAQLDISATVQANDERGVTFRVPALTQGQ